jgi:hypothetical protein
VLGDGPNIPRFIRIGPLECTFDGQTVTIDILRNLISKLFGEANKVTSNQLLLELQTSWIGQVIAEGNIVGKANENNIGYSFLSNACNEFHRHGEDTCIFKGYKSPLGLMLEIQGL